MNNNPQKIKIQDRVEIDNCVFYNSVEDNMNRSFKSIKQDLDNLIKTYGEDSFFAREDVSQGCSCCYEDNYYIVKSERLETDEEYANRMNKIKEEQDLENKKKEEAKLKAAIKVLEDNGFQVEKATWDKFDDMAVEEDE